MSFSENMYKGPITKLQHTVPREYLSSWFNGVIYTLRQGSNVPFPVRSLMGIEAESYFYQFPKLSESEEKTLDIIAQTLEIPQEIYSSFKMATVGSASFKELLETSPFATAQDKELANKIVRNGAEPLMSEIESKAWPVLKMLLRGDCSLDESDKKAFAKYMIYQMCRGKKFSQCCNQKCGQFSAESMTKIGDYLRWLLAMMICSNVLPHVNNKTFLLLDNLTEIEFITGDAPVFNLASGSDGKFDLYFPISPTRAIIFVDTDRANEYQHLSKPTKDNVNKLNEQLCRNCVEQIHASQKRTLTDNDYRPGPEGANPVGTDDRGAASID